METSIHLYYIVLSLNLVKICNMFGCNRGNLSYPFRQSLLSVIPGVVEAERGGHTLSDGLTSTHLANHCTKCVCLLDSWFPKVAKNVVTQSPLPRSVLSIAHWYLQRPICQMVYCWISPPTRQIFCRFGSDQSYFAAGKIQDLREGFHIAFMNLLQIDTEWSVCQINPIIRVHNG